MTLKWIPKPLSTKAAEFWIDCDGNATILPTCSRCGESLVGAENIDLLGLCNNCLSVLAEAEKQDARRNI